MPRSIHAYRSCRSRSSRKPSFHAPCSPIAPSLIHPSPITNCSCLTFNRTLLKRHKSITRRRQAVAIRSGGGSMQSLIRRIPFLVLAGAIVFIQAVLLQAASLPQATPEKVGMSSERLGRLDAAMQKAVDSGELPGAVVLIARDGQLVYAKSFGWQDRDKKIPMRNDSIFRLYSMTKPVVSVAAMMLVAEGKLGLQEPVSKYIPEFKNMKVGVESKEADAKTALTLVDAKRQMTVQDLLRHTSGLTYGVLGAPNAVKKMYNDAEIFSQKWVLADFCRALAKLPLQFQPGTTWEYNHSTDLLGRVVEVASGQTLDVFLAQRIFEPLKMAEIG